MHNIFTDMGLILIFSLIGSIISLRYRSPTVIGLLLAGALVGPHALSIVQSGEAIEIFSELGGALLLFTIGVGFSISNMVRQSFRALMITAFKMGLVFLISSLFSLLFGLPVADALIIGFVLSITSTAIFAGLVKDEFKNRPEVKLLFSVLVIEDIVGVVILTFFSSMKVEAVKSISTGVFVPIAFSVVFLGIAYIIFERLVRRFMWHVDNLNSSDALILAAFSVAFVLAFVSHMLGLSFGIGAFLGGSLVASVPVFKKVEHLLVPFNTIFASFFFFSVGMLFDWKAALGAIWLLLALNIINLLAKFAGTYFSTYLLGFDSKSAAFSALAMLSVGEFSILIAKEAAPSSSIDVVSLTTAIVMISAFFSSRLLSRERTIYPFLSSLFPRSERPPFRRLSGYLRNLMLYLEPGGRGFRRFLEQGSRLIFYGLLAAVVAGLTFIFSSIAPKTGILVAGAAMYDVVRIVGLLLFIAPFSAAVLAIKEILETAAEAFLQNECSALETGKRAKRALSLFALFFFTAFIIPIIFALISLPPIFYSIAAIPFAISILFLWDASRTAAFILRESPLKRRLLERRR